MVYTKYYTLLLIFIFACNHNDLTTYSNKAKEYTIVSKKYDFNYGIAEASKLFRKIKVDSIYTAQYFEKYKTPLSYNIDLIKSKFGEENNHINIDVNNYILDTKQYDTSLSFYTRKNKKETLQFKFSILFELSLIKVDESKVWILKSVEYKCKHLEKLPFEINLSYASYDIYKNSINSGFGLQMRFINENFAEVFRIHLESKSSELKKDDIRFFYFSYQDNITYLKSIFKNDGKLIIREDINQGNLHYRKIID